MGKNKIGQCISSTTRCRKCPLTINPDCWILPLPCLWGLRVVSLDWACCLDNNVEHIFSSCVRQRRYLQHFTVIGRCICGGAGLSQQERHWYGVAIVIHDTLEEPVFGVVDACLLTHRGLQCWMPWGLWMLQPSWP